MVDTVAITAGSGTSIATDDIGGVHYQRNKLVFGADGTNNGDVSKANPFPVNTDPTRVISYHGRACSFRMPGRAGTTGQNLFSLHNATASAVLVDLERLTVDMTATVVKAVTVLPPVIRVYRVTVLPTNGTAVTKVARDTALSTSASVTVLQDASADGTSSATTLTATIPAGNVASQLFAPRLITAAGYELIDTFSFLEGEAKLTLRALEGVVVRLDYVLATQNPVTDMWAVDARWTEYTLAT